MRTRLMQRTDSMNAGKRGAEDGDDDDLPHRKRPALANVVIEAVKQDNLQKLCSTLEPILRRVVSEEVERALAKLVPARLTQRPSPKRIEGADGRNLQLRFRTKLSLPLFTGGKLEGEQGAAVHVALEDVNTGLVVTSGPESCIKLDVVVLEGDFNTEDEEDWTEKEFESHVVKEREGKRPLLTGDLQVSLKEGIGSIGNLTFTDNSSWIKSRKFRLGLKVASGYCEGIRIREAKTEPFTVKDHRGELYRKHYPPSLNDEVWRLEKIGKDGSFHKRLNSNGIYSVEDFLRLMVRDAAKLRNILGSGMSNKMWEALHDHAKTCVICEKLYVFYPDNTRSVGVIFNHIYALCGLVTGDQYQPAESIADEQKMYVDSLVQKAYENWHLVVEYDAKQLHLSFRQGNRAIDYHNDIQGNQLTYLNTSETQNIGLKIDGHSESLGARYPNQSQILGPISRPLLTNSALGSQQFLIGDSSGTNNNGIQALTHGPHVDIQQGATLPATLNPFEEWTNHRDENFIEEEIRMRSHEILENDEMQHLLRLFSTNNPDDGYGFSGYPQTPMPNFDDRARNGRAVAGWLKIKAAMRWGFFVRKKAAERRKAKIVELDD